MSALGAAMGGVTGPAFLLATVAVVAPTLVQVVRDGGPQATLYRVAELGRTIDLSDAAQVRAAIGPVEGLPTRRSEQSAFAGYTLPAGEIIFNPDLGDRTFLGVSLQDCLPTATVRARLRGAEFAQGATRTTVALYEDTPYRDHPGTAFSFHEASPGCVRDFGIVQRKPAA